MVHTGCVLFADGKCCREWVGSETAKAVPRKNSIVDYLLLNVIFRVQSVPFSKHFFTCREAAIKMMKMMKMIIFNCLNTA